MINNTTTHNNTYHMANKEQERPVAGASPEEVKDRELDEQPRPTRKAGHTAVPSPEEGTEHKRIKGTRKAK
jgi:hypothetical protein